MPNRIVLCSDGTNNQGGFGRDTNVWRLYNLLKQRRGEPRQSVHYDDGVGTETSTPKKLMGLAFGWGLSRNIRELYAYLASHYQFGDHVYLFGFSRGAYTVRVLANMIDFCGLPKWDADNSTPEDLRLMVKTAEKAYKRWCKDNLGTMSFNNKQYAPVTGTRFVEQIKGKTEEGFDFIPVDRVYLGVWDTVNAAGMPVDELRRFMPAWIQNKTVERLPQCVRCGFHALAIDDERKTFDPTLWDELNLDPDTQYVEQVWFAGMHANVGGGYPKDGMAHVSLDWMVSRFERLSDFLPSGDNDTILEFNPDRKGLKFKANANSKMYDSRSGLGVYYRYCPRDVIKISKYSCGDRKDPVPLVHESVFDRIKQKTDFYSPTSLSEFAVVKNHNKKILRPKPGEEFENLAKQALTFTSVDKNKSVSEVSREEVTLNIRGRKRLYKVFLAFTLGVLALPFFKLQRLAFDWSQTSVEQPVAWVYEKIAPDILDPWLGWLAQHPVALVAIIGLFLLLRFSKSRIEKRQAAVNNDIWHNLNHDLLERITDSGSTSAGAQVKTVKPKSRGLGDLGVVGKFLR